VNKLYVAHRYLNEACFASNIELELLVNEDNLKVLLANEPLAGITRGLKNIASVGGVVAETKAIPSGTIVVISSDPKADIASIISMANNKFGEFYHNLNEALDKPISKKNDGKEEDDEETKKENRKKAWEPDEDEPPRAKDRFFEDRQAMLERSIDEALDGIAVPDGAAQPKIGVEMLEKALSAKTRSGITLKDALKKAGVTWHVAGPGSHVVVFKGKSGDEKWRVEPMTLSDKKVFEQTMESLWSVALGKSPNAKELEREAAKQRAKELGDHQKEISGLVDQITSKFIPNQQIADAK
jgi:hypothetical protein